MNERVVEVARPLVVERELKVVDAAALGGAGRSRRGVGRHRARRLRARQAG
jgi:hypothetical protein